MKRLLLLALVCRSTAAAAAEPPAPAAAPPTATESPSSAEDDDDDDDDDEDAMRVSADAEVSQTGPITYSQATVDVPLTTGLSLVPLASFLRAGPQAAGDTESFRFGLGGGVNVHPSDDWTLGALVEYGPRGYDLENFGGELSADASFGGGGAKDRPPVAQPHLGVSLTYYHWLSGNGPAGDSIYQGYLDASVALALPILPGFTFTPKAMAFWYDKALVQATGDRLGTVGVLARVGTLAPAAMGGLRVAYEVATHVAPFVEVDEILYASSMGGASEFRGGVRLVDVGPLTLEPSGGALWNRTSGPLVPPGAAGVLPLATLIVEVKF